MRGIPSLITDIRKKVFSEVARMAYAGKGYDRVDELPYVIVPGDQPLHRESVFLERARQFWQYLVTLYWLVGQAWQA